jgi:hypothetical protein
MIVRPVELDIPDDDPFKNDALGRRELEPPLTQFITAASGPLVLAIDGRFGSGKTTFLKMWERKLQEAGHACLYLNAWQTDFAVDPLAALVGELAEIIPRLTAPAKEKKELANRMKVVKKVGGRIARRSIPVAVRLVTAGLVDVNGIESDLKELASNLAEDGIKAYEEGKSDFGEFRDTLESLVKKIQGAGAGKVVILVDELDRCRPTYAIELLERIKHLFDVFGVVFVLGIDRAQLKHSVRAIYGSDFDASGYLRRFIDLDYCLPDPKESDYCSYLFKTLGIRGALSGRVGNPASEVDAMERILGMLFAAAGFSLRDQNQAVARLRVTIQTIPPKEHLFPVTLALFLFLREWRRNLYDDLLGGRIGADDVFDEISSLSGMQKFYDPEQEHGDSYTARLIEAIILLGSEELGQPSSKIFKYRDLNNSSEDSSQHRHAREIWHTMNQLRNRIEFGGSGFRSTQRRLEFTKDFVEFEAESKG